MFKGLGKIVRDNKSSSYPVFELTEVNCVICYTGYNPVPGFAHIYRSSSSQMFLETAVLKNFTMFTGKYLCCGLFLLRDSNIGVFLWILRNF